MIDEKKKIKRVKSIVGTQYVLMVIALETITMVLLKNNIINVLINNIIMIIIPLISELIIEKKYKNEIISSVNASNYSEIRTSVVTELVILAIFEIMINLNIVIIIWLVVYIFSSKRILKLIDIKKNINF